MILKLRSQLFDKSPSKRRQLNEQSSKCLINYAKKEEFLSFISCIVNQCTAYNFFIFSFTVQRNMFEHWEKGDETEPSTTFPDAIHDAFLSNFIAARLFNSTCNRFTESFNDITRSKLCTNQSTFQSFWLASRWRDALFSMNEQPSKTKTKDNQCRHLIGDLILIS